MLGLLIPLLEMLIRLKRILRLLMMLKLVLQMLMIPKWMLQMLMMPKRLLQMLLRARIQNQTSSASKMWNTSTAPIRMQYGGRVLKGTRMPHKSGGREGLDGRSRNTGAARIRMQNVAGWAGAWAVVPHQSGCKRKACWVGTEKQVPHQSGKWRSSNTLGRTQF